MTIKQLRKLLKGLPQNIDIAIECSEEELMPICPTDSGIIQIQFNESKEKRLVFVLCPCSCDVEAENVESEISLN